MLGLYSVLWGKIEEKRVEIQNREETLTRNLLEDKNKDKEEGPCIVWHPMNILPFIYLFISKTEDGLKTMATLRRTISSNGF